MKKSSIPTFPSDDDLKKYPRLGDLLPPEPGKTLMSKTKPHYEGGYKIIHRCNEFRLIQEYGPEGPKRIEWSNEIRHRFLKSAMRVNNQSSISTTSWEDRVKLADALDGLRDYYERNQDDLQARSLLLNPAQGDFSISSGCHPCARDLGATLGRSISKCLQADDTDQSIKDLTASFGVALRAVARLNGQLEDKRSGNRPKPHDLILAALKLYRQNEQRPFRKDIQLLLSQEQFEVKGKDSYGVWADLFNSAGLGGLPEE